MPAAANVPSGDRMNSFQRVLFIAGVKPASQNIGLSEIAVFEANP